MNYLTRELNNPKQLISPVFCNQIRNRAFINSFLQKIAFD